MGYQEKTSKIEDLVRPEQFKDSRYTQDEKQPSEDQLTTGSDDGGYTPQENQFADGKGTQLNEEIAPYRGDIEDELSEEVDRAEEEKKLEEEHLDEDFENFKEKSIDKD